MPSKFAKIWAKRHPDVGKVNLESLEKRFKNTLSEKLKNETIKPTSYEIVFIAQIIKETIQELAAESEISEKHFYKEWISVLLELVIEKK